MVDIYKFLVDITSKCLNSLITLLKREVAESLLGVKPGAGEGLLPIARILWMPPGAQCAVGQYILELVPWLFFIAGTVSLVLMDSVMILEQSAHIFWRLGPLLGAWGAPGGPQVGPKCLKLA